MSRKHSRSVVRIINPHEGRATYTTMRSASEMVKRGIATYEAGIGLRLITDLPNLRTQQQEILQAQLDASIVEDRGGVIFWNGSDTRRSAVHPPFGKGKAPQFPRPGDFSRFAKVAA